MLEEHGTERARLHPMVESLLEQIRLHPSCGDRTAFGDLVHFVRDRMLAVALVSKLVPQTQFEMASSDHIVPIIRISSDPPPLEDGTIVRANAKTMAAILSSICTKPRTDSGYLIPGGNIHRGTLVLEASLPAKSEFLGHLAKSLQQREVSNIRTLPTSAMLNIEYPVSKVRSCTRSFCTNTLAVVRSCR